MTKYHDNYAGIRKAQQERIDERGPFNLSRLPRGGIQTRIAQSRLFHSLIRRLAPIVRLGKICFVTRYDDVAYVRREDALFEVPYGLEMTKLGGGRATCFLGLPRGEEHSRQIGWITRAMKPEEVEGVLAPMARRIADRLILCAGGEIDAVHDYLSRTFTETCIAYFGLDTDHADAFAEWLMSLSALLFADPDGNPVTRELALRGAARARDVIERSIQLHRKGLLRPDTILRRFVEMSGQDGGPSDDQIVAMTIGLVVGWAPTGGAAGGFILDTLLSRPHALALAQSAAKENDDSALKKVLSEAMRFKPPINPGLFRRVTRDTKIRNFQFREGDVILAAQMSAMFDPTATAGAQRFNPDREYKKEDLQFGGRDYLHYCIGQGIAETLLLETFKPLLRQRDLKRAKGKAGRLAQDGPFPRHLQVTFQPEYGFREQSMAAICCEMKEGADLAAVNAEIAKLGNPAELAVSDALDASARVHFAHLAVVEGDAQKREPNYLLGDFAVDGPADLAIEKFVETADDMLLPIYSLGCGVESKEDLKTLLKANTRKIRPGPWFFRRDAYASGLDFQGTPELSVSRIELDKQIADFARECFDDILKEEGRQDTPGLDTLRQLRRKMREEGETLALIRPSGQKLKLTNNDAISWSDALLTFRRDASFWRNAGIAVLVGFLFHVLVIRGYVSVISQKAEVLSDAFSVFLLAIVSALIGATVALAVFAIRYVMVARRERRGLSIKRFFEFVIGNTYWFYVATAVLGLAHFVLTRRPTDNLLELLFGVPSLSEWAARLTTAVGAVWATIVSLVVGTVLVALLVGLFALFVVALLRRSEKTAPIEDFEPPFDHVSAITSRENHPDTVQNHLISVVPLKTDPRWMRQLTLGLAFWGVGKLVRYASRPGFVIDIGTIHFARWFRMPKTDKLMFLANYDGSWESYLEDFITKVHRGQTAVWSNGVGFPKTKFLMFEGASDGARFKRWVRRQQIPSLFWYSRFPKLTTDQMRNNALIAEGLAKIRTDTEARAFFSLFGSRPRLPDTIESNEVQTLVFSGLRGLSSSAFLPVRLPSDLGQAGQWLNEVLTVEAAGGTDQKRVGLAPTASLGANGAADSNLVALTTADKVKAARLTASDPPIHSPSSITFGDHNPEQRAMFVAFSAAGLERFLTGDEKTSQGERETGALDTFPTAFRDGMASKTRARILGDFGGSDPENWVWGAAESTPDLVLLLYAKNGAALDERIKHETKQLEDAGFSVGEPLRMQDLPQSGALIEPFGFRDGISQPIIRGSNRFHDSVNDIHVVEPGEFILGYPDNRGHFPPTPAVLAEAGDARLLPSLPGGGTDRFPSFGAADAFAPRDFGRNGSYLVIRQLEQDVSGFDKFTEQQARAISNAYAGLKIDKEWVAARLVGRWRDGSSLVRYPDKSFTDRRRSKSSKNDDERIARAEHPDNDFRFGVEDPQGLRCPYGAHIRRANPRDSFAPGSEQQIEISNRHRLLRRGRPYVGEDLKKPEGLLFMCLNADIERQFEFVQQTWIVSPSFHGLRNERDAIVTPVEGSGNQMIVPTPSGPLTLPNLSSFVTVKGGGYFFLPSRSALAFLANAAGGASEPQSGNY